MVCPLVVDFGPAAVTCIDQHDSIVCDGTLDCINEADEEECDDGM